MIKFREFCEKFYRKESRFLTEMSMVIIDNNKKRSIWVENPTHYDNRYFKIFNNDSVSKATKVARISMINPRYMTHRNDDGKENWILTLSEKRYLINILNQKIKINPNITNWQRIILTYNRDSFQIDPDNLITNEMTKEEYNRLATKKNAISLDLSILDYMKL